ncbi:MAG: glycosyltransferase family 4 protein [Ruminococcaceae bacterium]|nr:glycosyltransferase family 4 protein [Oscillospiraceae bacterium]
MRILIDDGLQASVGTGIGNYAGYLAGSLAALPDTEVVREDFAAKGPRRRARLAYLRYLESAAYRSKLQDFDVVHYANYAMPRNMPQGTLSAVTIHDLTAFCHPETLPRAYAIYNRAMIRRAVKHADLLFTVSESIREELIARFPQTKDKVVAVHPGYYEGTADTAVAEHYENSALTGLKKRKFFLFVGTVEKRKNPGVLMEAYRRLCKAGDDGGFSLVIAGRDGFGAEDYHKLAKMPPVLGDIRFTGYVSAADCAKLYQEAAAFVFPSIYEGFGSPQTECMACGLPLLLSDIPTNREVSANYGRYFPPHGAERLSELMADVVGGRAVADGELALERLAHFRWSDAAKKTRHAYEIYLKIRPVYGDS